MKEENSNNFMISKYENIQGNKSGKKIKKYRNKLKLMQDDLVRKSTDKHTILPKSKVILLKSHALK